MGGLIDDAVGFGGDVVGGAADVGGTVATGAVDTFVADPGNSLLGVNAENMGVFEEQAAGSKAVSALSLGFLGEGGLVSDVLMPGQGRPGSEQGTGLDQGGDGGNDTGGPGVDVQMILVVGVLAVAAYLAFGRGS